MVHSVPEGLLGLPEAKGLPTALFGFENAPASRPLSTNNEDGLVGLPGFSELLNLNLLISKLERAFILCPMCAVR